LKEGNSKFIDSILNCYNDLLSISNISNIPMYFLNSKFTIIEIKHLYEYLLKVPINNSRMRERLSKFNSIIQLDGDFNTENIRPSQLYKINKDNNFLMIIKI